MAQDTQDRAKFAAYRSVPTVGNITREPRKIEGKEKVGVGFGLAVNSLDFKGEEHTRFYDVTLWGYWAEAVLAEYKKGERVNIIGDVFFGEYDGKTQDKIEGHQIFKVVYPPRGEEGSGSRRSRRDDDDDEDRPARSRRSSRDDDDDDDEPPARSRRTSRRDDDEDDDRPARSRRSSRDDDDDDEPPARSRRTSRRDDGDEIPD